MPFVGEQPKSAGAVKVYGRSATTEIDIEAGTFVVMQRSGSTTIGIN
jgi:hypothetical protein